MANIKNNTHIIIKVDDLEYLTKRQIKQLAKIVIDIQHHRQQDGKKAFNEYYICNKDEPYWLDVLQAILYGEDKKLEETK